MSLYLQPLLDTHAELIVDGFAGGGGASSGIEQALGRPVDVAINHDAAALKMHEANHPQTLHLQSDIFEVNPREATGGRPVGFAWFSPDCTFHSKARGAKPIRHATKKRRALAWVITYWAGTVRPRVITLENVEEFAQWGPLIGPPDALRPCPKRRGRTFRRWVKSLRDLGYVVEWRELRACDYGAPTIRKRLYLIARCDGKPIVWPKPTHSGVYADLVTAEWQVIGLKDALEGATNVEERAELTRQLREKEALVATLTAKKKADPSLKPFRTAAECIDWDIPMASIFLTKEEAKEWGTEHGQASPIRPLAENTQRRIARGVKRYVIDNPKPFLVSVAHSDVAPNGSKRWGKGEYSLDAPAKTLAASKDLAIVSPVVAGVGGRAGQSPERPGDKPFGTITSKGDAAVVAPVMLRNQTSDRSKPADDPTAPLGTVLAHGANHAVVAPVMVKNNHGEKPFSGPNEPLTTIVAGGIHHAVVAPYLTPRYGEREGQEPRTRSLEDPAPTVVNDGNGGSLVAASVTTFYGGPGGDTRGVNPAEPLRVQGTENRFGVVAASLMQNNEGFYKGDGRDLREPNAAVCANGSLQSLLGVSFIKERGTSSDADPNAPLGTTSAGGTHHGLAAAHMVRDFGESVGSPADAPIGTVTATGMGKAGLVASFLTKYYGESVGQGMGEPVHTLPTLDKFGFVSVRIGSEAYTITDIAMRMLQPKELYAAQGFRPGYIFERGSDGRKLTKTEQVRMCGNSVCPDVAEALVRANVPEMIARPEIAKKVLAGVRA